MSAAHHDEDEVHTGLKVLATRGRVRTVQVARPTPHDTTFIAATAKGLGITLKHFAKNLFRPMRSAAGRSRAGAPVDERGTFGLPLNDIETVQYPEEKVTYPERFRGLHRLTLRDDGSTRCVACMCCPTVCPAHCITIVPEESTSTSIEKRPAIFEIDELRCVVCGLCVEACPCDAIRMDTGVHAHPVEDRADAIENRESLLGRGVRSIAKQGGEGPDWRATAGEKSPVGDVNR